MFFPLRSAPLKLTEDRLRGLRCSLNAPVIALSDLPVGPAKAAILLHREEDGRPNVTIGVRSLKSGGVALYSYDGAMAGDDTLALGADAALSFGESMGFLFDDDELAGVGSGDRARALSLWRDLLGGDPAELEVEREAAGGDDVVDLPVVPSDPDELLLEDLVEIPLPSPEPIDLEAGPWPDSPAFADECPGPALDEAARVPPKDRAPLPLSKFRHPPQAHAALIGSEAVSQTALPEREQPDAVEPVSEPPARPRHKTALGRLKLVRRRLTSRQGDGRNWVTRLLTSF